MKDDNKTVVLGASGMLGTDLMYRLDQAGLNTQGYDLPDFDICDRQQVSKAVDSADVIINCAAYTNVEKAESEEEIAFRVNADAVGMLGRVAADNGTPVIHISTDFVFDGQLDRPYSEEDQTNPISAYGRSKLAGEQRLMESSADACIIRVQWTYGHNGTNFIRKLLDFASARNSLKVVDDQQGAPTSTLEVASAICRIILRVGKFPQGIYHFAASGYATRYETAKYIFDRMGLAAEVLPCKSDEFPSAAARPLNSRFSCTKIEQLLGQQIRPWQGPLGEFLDQL